MAYTSCQYILDRSASSIPEQKPYNIVLLKDFHSATSCCFHTSTFNGFPNRPTRAFSVLERQKTKEYHLSKYYKSMINNLFPVPGEYLNGLNVKYV